MRRRARRSFLGPRSQRCRLHWPPPGWQPPPPVSNGVYEYDAATDSWRERAPMRFPVRDGACAAVGNKICVLGGIDFSAGGNGFGGQVDVIQVYDVETDTWDVIGNDGRVTLFLAARDRHERHRYFCELQIGLRSGK